MHAASSRGGQLQSGGKDLRDDAQDTEASVLAAQAAERVEMPSSSTTTTPSETS